MIHSSSVHGKLEKPRKVGKPTGGSTFITPRASIKIVGIFGDMVSVEDEICLQCGDKGFENAFVYCTMCLHYVVHRYCLDVIPKTLDEFVPWVCDFCQDETLTSGLESDHPTTAHEFSRDETKGVVLDLELVDENGFKESVAESSCLDPIDEAGSRSDTGDGSKEALRSDLNDGNEENNLQVVIIKPESCVHDNGFDVESAVVPRDIRNGEAMRSKTNARRQFPGKGADPGCSSKHSQILASPLRGGHKRTHPEFYREQHFGRRRHSWEKRVKWNPASGEYHAATSTESSYSANANPSHVFRKPNDPDLSTAVSKDADPSSPAAPVAIPVWRGFFEISSRSEIITGVACHISSRACQKVHDAVSKFMPVLSVALFPKMDVWPKSFNSREPNGDSIALFFFPSRRSCGAFYDLIHDMLKENLALRSCVLPGAELLIFTSRELPHPYSSFQGDTYLWGVFRTNSSSGVVNKHINKYNSDDSSRGGRGRGRGGNSRQWRFPYRGRRFFVK